MLLASEKMLYIYIDLNQLIKYANKKNQDVKGENMKID